MKIEINEAQAEWIRIGLQCYRNTCQVPASFGSREFLDKLNQIQSAIDWFDEEVQNARFWEERKYSGEILVRQTDEEGAPLRKNTLREQAEILSAKWQKLKEEDPSAWEKVGTNLLAYPDLYQSLANMLKISDESAEEVSLPDFPKHGSTGTCKTCGKNIRYITYTVDGAETGKWIHRISQQVSQTYCAEAVFGAKLEEGPA